MRLSHTRLSDLRISDARISDLRTSDLRISHVRISHVRISGARLSHVRISVVGGRRERLLDRAGVDPTDQVEDRACLVVGTTGPRPAERLLAAGGPARLALDVEVPGSDWQL